MVALQALLYPKTKQEVDQALLWCRKAFINILIPAVTDHCELPHVYNALYTTLCVNQLVYYLYIILNELPYNKALQSSLHLYPDIRSQDKVLLTFLKQQQKYHFRTPQEKDVIIFVLQTCVNLRSVLEM